MSDSSEMPDKVFWDIIGSACKHDRGSADWSEAWYGPLVGELEKLSPDEILGFHRWFGRKVDALYTRGHRAAASLINGVGWEGGFDGFRCWIVGMGKVVYEAALANPDTLAAVIDVEAEYHEAEIRGVTRVAWESWGWENWISRHGFRGSGD